MVDTNNIMVFVFAFIGLILFINLIIVVKNLFTGSSKAVVEEVNPLRDEIRSEINEKIKPHLNSLEGMYTKSESDAESFSAYVVSKVKDKLAPLVAKDEKLVEEEICKCCGDYESADCKENFCLEGSGISCGNS